MKKIIIIPVAACLVIVIINALFGDVFGAGLWFLAFFLLSITLLPIAFNMDDKNVPILQIFSTLIFFAIFFTISAFIDFKQAGFLLGRSFLYGLGIGLGTMAAVMLLKGK